MGTGVHREKTPRTTINLPKMEAKRIEQTKRIFVDAETGEILNLREFKKKEKEQIIEIVNEEEYDQKREYLGKYPLIITTHYQQKTFKNHGKRQLELW